MTSPAPDCVFCRIVAGSIPGTFVHREDDVIAIRDIQPVAPVHVLVMPTRHVASVLDGAGDGALLGHCLQVAAQVARAEGLEERGFRLIVNTGEEGGQTVDHLHVHVLGGKPLGPMLAGSAH